MAIEIDPRRDPLRVLESSRTVLELAQHVVIEPAALTELANHLANLPEPATDWSPELHPIGRNAAEVANLVLVVDALNFCFWSTPGSTRPRWSITYEGETYNGYYALAAALRRAVEQGAPLADADYLAGLSEAELRELLRGDYGCDEIPLLHARLANLHEAGYALRAYWDGTFLNAIRHAGGSATRLVRAVVRAMPSFNDVAPYDHFYARFYKRAQILVADLHGAFAGEGPGLFRDLDGLTAFADYKVPQVLREHGVLRYGAELSAALRDYQLLPPGGVREVEIRAATVWSVEWLRQELAASGRNLAAFQIDWLLWRIGQRLPPIAEPYHRTLTIYY
jgi:hypothetical protein